MIRLVLLSLFLFKVNLVLCIYDNSTSFLDVLLSDELEKIYNKDLRMNWTPEDELNAADLGEIFDFIVVGAGSAGSVIANRLTEISDWKVLLLEAGEEPADYVNIPMLLAYLPFTDYNWKYLAERQPNMGLGIEMQRMHYPRGKALGGSSTINFMLHTRGNRLDYDRWAEKGNKGWSYDDILPYFKKSEDFLVKIQDREYHQQGGYLGVQDVSYRTESGHAFVEAMQEFGYDYVDYNGRQQVGVSYAHATNRNGRRSSGYTAFLLPISDRRNLKVITRARVSKVLIDEHSKTAYGINFIKDGRNFIVKASKEVILSAGALNSPQILMLSGIGPKHHLSEMGIHTLQDLPVGQKLYDHLMYLGLTFTVNANITFNSSLLQRMESFVEFFKYGTGPLTPIANVDALSYVRTSISDDPDPSYPDLELLFIASAMSNDRGEVFRKIFRISDEDYDAIWKPLEGKPAFNIFPMPLHPRSHGFLKLRSRNPYRWPRFFGNYLTDPENHDLKTLIGAIRLIQQLIQMPAFQKYDTKLWSVPVPGCEFHVYDSDAYWECAVRHLAASVFHYIGTCKMGPPSDPEAIVSDELKIYGINNLRVADTSIIPEPLSAHIGVPAFMIGEKAADLIKNSWLYK